MRFVHTLSNVIQAEAHFCLAVAHRTRHIVVPCVAEETDTRNIAHVAKRVNGQLLVGIIFFCLCHCNGSLFALCISIVHKAANGLACSCHIAAAPCRTADGERLAFCRLIFKQHCRVLHILVPYIEGALVCHLAYQVVVRTETYIAQHHTFGHRQGGLARHVRVVALHHTANQHIALAIAVQRTRHACGTCRLLAHCLKLIVVQCHRIALRTRVVLCLQTNILQLHLHACYLLGFHGYLRLQGAVFILACHYAVVTGLQVIESKHTVVPVVGRLLGNLRIAFVQLHFRTVQRQPLVVAVGHIHKFRLVEYVHQLIARLHPTANRGGLRQLALEPLVEMLVHTQCFQLAIVVVAQTVCLRRVVMETALAQEPRHSQRTQHAQPHIITIETQVTAQDRSRTGPYRQRVGYLYPAAAGCHLVALCHGRLACSAVIQHQQVVGLRVQRIGVYRDKVVHIIGIRLLGYRTQVAVITILQLFQFLCRRIRIVTHIAVTRFVRRARHNHRRTRFLQHIAESQALHEVRVALPVAFRVGPHFGYWYRPYTAVVGIMSAVPGVDVYLYALQPRFLLCLMAGCQTRCLTLLLGCQTHILRLYEHLLLHRAEVTGVAPVYTARDIADMVYLVMPRVELLHTCHMAVVYPFRSIHTTHRLHVLSVYVAHKRAITCRHIHQVLLIGRYACPEITGILAIRRQHITLTVTCHYHLPVFNRNARPGKGNYRCHQP